MAAGDKRIRALWQEMRAETLIPSNLQDVPETHKNDNCVYVYITLLHV